MNILNVTFALKIFKKKQTKAICCLQGHACVVLCKGTQLLFEGIPVNSIGALLEFRYLDHEFIFVLAWTHCLQDML